MPDTRTTYLERHGQKWRVIVHVPLAAQPKIGKRHLKESLNTSSLATANLLKSAVVDRFKAIIEEALREVQPSDYHAEAKAIRAARLLHPKTITVTDFGRHGHEVEVEAVADDAALVEDLAERLEATHGEDYAKSFTDVALGRATPIKEHLQAFKDDNDYQAKSLLELDGAFKRLLEWLSSTRRAQTLEGIDGDVASAYMRHLVNGLGISPKTAGKYISFFRSYWKWLGHKKLVKDGAVWANTLVPKGKAVRRHDDLEPDDGKRAFKPDEMKKLLAGAQGDMLTLIKIAALTGMRIEEVYGLRIRDVVDGFFMVRVGKTANAKRRVPIHPDLEAIVKGLTEAKEASAYLVDPEAEVIEKTGLRSQAASKRFGTLRRGLGLDERPNGKLKSNIDFHSLRRWFIKSARDALLAGATGYNPWTIADVVGHDDADLKDTLKMTLGLYPGKSPDDALRACVAAVQLPA